MKKYEIWSEGCLCTGMEGTSENAIYFGIEKGETFKDACIRFFAKDNNNRYFNAENMTYWGCRLFDNEIDARKRFG